MLPNKKNCYHSELAAECAASESGKIMVRFKSGVTPSKFAGRSPFIALEVAGDAMEHQYTVENDAIAASLAHVPLNTPLWLQATGSREAAVIALWDEAGQPLPSTPALGGGTPTFPTPAPAQAPPAATPPAQRNGNGFHDKPTIVKQMAECLLASHALLQRFSVQSGLAFNGEDVRTIATSFFIEINRGGRELGHVDPPKEPKDPVGAMAGAVPPPAPPAPPRAPQPAGVGGGPSMFDKDDDDGLPF